MLCSIQYVCSNGAIIALNIYREDDFPLYKRGIPYCFDRIAVNPVVVVYEMLLYLEKQPKGKLWNKMTEEREYYRKHSTDRGNERLDFVFEH